MRRALAAFSVVVAACAGPGVTPSTVTRAETTTAAVPSTTAPPSPAGVTAPTTSVPSLPILDPIPTDRLDTGAASKILIPRTEAEAAAFGARHNLAPNRPGLVRLGPVECEVDAPGRLLFRGTVTLEDTDRARVGLVFTIFPISAGSWFPGGWTASPVGIGSQVEVEFTSSGPWLVPIERIPSGDAWSVTPRLDRIGTCLAEVFWSDTPTDPPPFETFGRAEPAYAEGVFRFDAPTGTLAALAEGVRFADWEDPALLWAYVAWIDRPLPFTELWIPDPNGPVRAESVEFFDDGECRRASITSRLGRIVRAEGCPEPLVPEGATPTGDTLRVGFELWESSGLVAAVDPDLGVAVTSPAVGDVTALVGTLVPVATGSEPPEPVRPDSLLALERLIRRTLAPTDEIRRGLVRYGDGYLLFTVSEVPDQGIHDTWVRIRLARFVGNAWRLEPVAQEPWTGCAYVRVADEGSGRYAVVIPASAGWHVSVGDDVATGLWFQLEPDVPATAEIADESAAFRCRVDLAS